MKKTVKKIGRKSISLASKPLKVSEFTRKGTAKALTVALREISPDKLYGYNSAIQRDTNKDYALWLRSNSPNQELIELQREKATTFKATPKFSILLPVYNVPPHYLKECIDSVVNQSYANWELCIADDKSTNTDIVPVLEEYAEQDKRIKVVFRKTNGHISEATNSALKIATGDFITLLDNDDILWPNALYEFAKRINEQPTTDFIYSDEDKIDATGKVHTDPFFKPDWNPDLLRSINYITHFTAIKSNIIKKVGGLRKGFEGSQDWDLFLRATREAKNIQHIDKILYSWRIIPTSTAGGTSAKPYVIEAQRKALVDDAKYYSTKNSTISHGYNESYWKTDYPIKGRPLVSIVIPTKDKLSILRKCIESVLAKTAYDNYEIVIVDTGSTDPNVWKYFEKITEQKNIKVVNWHKSPFSYSKSCNFGVSKSSGEYLLFLNNDTEVLKDSWLEELLQDAARPEIGGVGAMLLYPGKEQIIQHAGVAVGNGPDRVACNVGNYAPLRELDFNQMLNINNRRNYLAVTAACMMVSRKKFLEVKGFDENDFKVTYNDVDLGLKLVKAGYRNLYNPYVKLIHHESISLGRPEESQRNSKEISSAMESFRKKWSQYIEHDPTYNKNYTKEDALFRIDTKG